MKNIKTTNKLNDVQIKSAFAKEFEILMNKISLQHWIHKIL